ARPRRLAPAGALAALAGRAAADRSRRSVEGEWRDRAGALRRGRTLLLRLPGGARARTRVARLLVRMAGAARRRWGGDAGVESAPGAGRICRAGFLDGRAPADRKPGVVGLRGRHPVSAWCPAGLDPRRLSDLP